MKAGKLFRSRLFIITTSILATLVLLLIITLRTGIIAPPGATRDHEPDQLHLVTLFNDEDQHAILNRELELFNELYPVWEIEHSAVPYRELRSSLHTDGNFASADIVTLFNPALFDDLSFHEPPIPWSGELWGLYYHIPTLSAALGQMPAPPQNLAELEQLFQNVADAGLRPLALGASHGWPLTALVQHTAGLLTIENPHPARDKAAGRLPVDSEPVQQTVGLLKIWREQGWISSAAPSQSWTAGPREIFSGEAAFTLLNQQALTPIPVSRRTEIGFMPFPGDWASGSVIYLARPASSKDRQSVRELARFLTSPGTVGRLQRNLARPFFGGVQDVELPGEIIPSITSDPNSAYHRSLWQAARSAIWDD